ncbi:hypothetical protein RHGRI_007743 [Rhododendron griersonianum]|uniref:Bulb-type lectin domain-containing protein n=1 Tax=Rhododendron griersonianum TaxID=479676 RepID=A0AAV6KXR0_9ERIC|nr:hypothetical protein RHGRI_007743 [Rhododendron griersonianum]
MGIRPKSTHNSVFLYSLISVFYSLSLLCHGANSITQGQIIRGGETITSPSQKFVLGFFGPGNSVSRYVGIWYNETEIQSVVWVANRESPISSEFGILTLGNTSNLMVLDGYGNPIWSTNSPAVPGNSTSIAILMDTGNLILSSSESVGDQGKAIWQSFDDPTDTFLPGMKVYIDVQSDEDHVFTSWKSENDPSIGKYSMGIDPRGSPQIVI